MIQIRRPMIRRGKSITGKLVGPNKTQHKTIKPSKTRKIIRRYHFLNQTKLKLLKLLKLDDTNNLLYASLRNGNNEFCGGCDLRHKGMNATIEAQLIKINQYKDDRILLYKLLGYVYYELTDSQGLANYQMASKMGQDSKRGGDSSKILIEWMKEIISKEDKKAMRALEIGSLSSRNKISTSGIFNPVVRIDLNNSNDEEGIIRQDFMKRPIPKDESDKFDLISCSLVLNFVPTPIGRGEMCERFEQFLKKEGKGYVFIVLPLPCLANSRYMTSGRFHSMMKSIGYNNLQYKEAKKVCYMLYERETDDSITKRLPFTKKKQCRDGPGMNNFNIMLSKD